MTTRASGRTPADLRPITFTRDYTEMANGSVLVEFGRTRVLCTASVEARIPPWLKGSGKGWVTAEYSMLPGSSPERVDREAARGKQSGARRRSNGSSGARCARSPTCGACPTCRSPSTATCCRPTAARAPRRSAAAGSRCTTRARGSSQAGDAHDAPDARSRAPRSRSASSTACRCSISSTPRTCAPKST